MRKSAFLAALTLSLSFCTFSRDFSIKKHELLMPPPGGLVNSYNLEEQLAAGYIPEVLEFLVKSKGAEMDSARFARVLGQAVLERGDFRAARLPLERAFAGEGRPHERAETAWRLSQSFYWTGDFAQSAAWARTAISQGLRVPAGWVAFLDSGKDLHPYSGASPGERIRLSMNATSPRVPRVKVEINGNVTDEMVFDTGASMSLITNKAATALGLVKVAGGETTAYGLHRVAFPLHMAWADTARIGTVTLEHVPFGVVPDDALTFQTASGAAYQFAGVLGAHFLKEFDWRVEYGRKTLLGLRLDPEKPRGSRDQNLFFRRLKPMIRVSVNQRPWFLFLLDTGSEPSMVTRAGLRKAKTSGIEALAPMTLEGIGKSRVSWGKISDITVGAGRFMISYKDIVVREDSEGIEDGVLGSSFLANFETEILFSSMTVLFELPSERLLRESQANVPAPVY